MSALREFWTFMLAPAHFGWRGRTFMLLLSVLLIGGALVAVPCQTARVWKSSRSFDDNRKFEDIVPVWEISIGVIRDDQWLTEMRRILYPLWAVNVVMAAGLVIIIRAVIRHEARCTRHNKGLCWNCGYNPRGTQHDQCPECGCHLLLPPSWRGVDRR